MMVSEDIEICFNCKEEIKGMELLRIKQLNWQHGIKKDSIDWKYSMFCRECKKDQEEQQSYINSFED